MPKEPGKPKPSPKKKPKATKRQSEGSRYSVPRLMKMSDLIRRGVCPPKKHLAETFETSVRTIERDFEFLRLHCGMEFDFDRVRNVHHVTSELMPLPVMQLTTPEIMTLLIATRGMQIHQGAGLYEIVLKAIAKITTFMSDAQAAEWKRLDALFTYCGLPSIGRLNPEVFPILAEVLLDSEELDIFYLKRDADEPEWRRVRPLHLYFRSNRWYLWAEDKARNLECRRFVLSSIRELRRTGQKFARPQDLDPQAAVANTMGMYSGGVPEPIRLLLDRRAARWFEDEPLHPTQQITPLPGGRFELIAQLAITPELEGELLRWGLQVEVLEPQRLDDAIRASGRAIAERPRTNLP